jgi:organic hydroperoxide reductase OsmC/OhrA
MQDGKHHYEIRLVWNGDNTTDYKTYSRQHRMSIDGKADVVMTADAAFRGDASKHNPEDLLVAAVSSCHMLSYLALCAKYGINVLSYEDEATGVMEEDGKGGGKFTQVVIRPRVKIADASQIERAQQLHHRAHEQCFIASSVNFEIVNGAEVRAGEL